MSTTVDRHRQAVYDAEDVAFGGTTYDEPLPFVDAADLLTTFCAAAWWQALGLSIPAVVPTRVDSSRSYAECDGDPVVHLAPAGCTAATAGHELAHIVAHCLGGTDEPAHGPAFRRADIALAGALMGTVAAERLAAAFADAGLGLGRATDLGPPPSERLGFWTTWRSARTLAASTPAPRGPIAL
jgi:hypothetical protein